MKTFKRFVLCAVASAMLSSGAAAARAAGIGDLFGQGAGGSVREETKSEVSEKAPEQVVGAENGKVSTVGDAAEPAKQSAPAVVRNAPATEDAGDQGDDIVYITPRGKKYHRKGCSTIRKSSRQVTRAQAREMGKTPCKVCRPD